VKKGSTSIKCNSCRKLSTGFWGVQLQHACRKGCRLQERDVEGLAAASAAAPCRSQGCAAASDVVSRWLA
jgi:hypothetical protein